MAVSWTTESTINVSQGNMDPSKPRKVTSVKGRVTAGNYALGTKSERQAVFIETAENRWLLRRKGAPAFGDRSLDEFVGHTVECDGFVIGETLLADKVEVAKD